MHVQKKLAPFVFQIHLFRKKKQQSDGSCNDSNDAQFLQD